MFLKPKYCVESNARFLGKMCIMKMKTLEVTAYRIKKLLQETGWSQKELGQKISVSQQTVQRWAAGLVSPTPDNLDKLTEVTGHPPHWFMLAPDAEDQDSSNVESLTEDERRLLELYREFPDVESKNMLLVFEMRLKELKKIYSKYFESRDH